MRRMRSLCCARAASGHAAAPPTSVMNSRRLIASPQGSEQGIVAGQTGRLEVDKTALGDVRFGSKADIEAPPPDVRFTPKSGHQFSALGCRLSAKSRHS